MRDSKWLVFVLACKQLNTHKVRAQDLKKNKKRDECVRDKSVDSLVNGKCRWGRMSSSETPQKRNEDVEILLSIFLFSLEKSFIFQKLCVGHQSRPSLLRQSIDWSTANQTLEIGSLYTNLLCAKIPKACVNHLCAFYWQSHFSFFFFPIQIVFALGYFAFKSAKPIVNLMRFSCSLILLLPGR